MKSKLNKRIEVQSDWRRGAVAIIFSLAVSFGLISAAAQQSRKRITSVWTTTTAEGSFVTVDADSPLNDYEAYTRGDRFYVKIPLADLPSARGSLLGRGFDDVQIQRYGDGILISFRLLPATTARVEQTMNRLEVIFSTPGRIQNARMLARDDIGSRTRARRIEDSSGPMPPSTTKSQTESSRTARPHSSRGSSHVTTGSNRSSHKAQPKSSPSVDRTLTTSRAAGSSSRNSGSTGASPSPSPSASNRPGSTGAATSNSTPRANASPQPGANATASSSATPLPSPTPGATAPAASASPNSTPSTSVAPIVQSSSPTASESPANVSSDREATSWSSRMNYAKWWVKLNWAPLLIGGLVFLLLLGFLVYRRGAKRAKAIESKPAKQPSTIADAEKTSATVQEKPKAESAAAAGVASSPVASEARAKSAPESTPVRRDEPVAEHEDREVFEI